MKTKTFDKLQKLSQKYPSNNFGKIVQCLCALAFYEELKCNPNEITVNLVEGVDIIINSEEQKYAIEVKTTSRKEISLGEKDFEGYKKFDEQEYISIFCVLNMDLFSGLLLIRQKNLRRKKTWLIDELYEDDDLKDLSKKINERFEQLIENHFAEIEKKGLNYLLEKLKKENIRYAGK